MLGILQNVEALSEFSSLSPFLISLIETSLNEKCFTFSSFYFISKMRRWFLHVLVAWSTGSAKLELQSTIYEC